MGFLLNTWYVGAIATEVAGEKLFSRKILGTSVLMYRKADGTAVAMQDRCPHRFAPLHLGKRVGDDEVQCPYHALRFNSNGECTHSPHGDGTVPARACVRTFPLVERYGFLWIWMGARRADPSMIPAYTHLETSPPTAVAHGYMHMPANYQLIVDNVMDLSHVDHVHGPLLNTGGKLSPQKPPVIEDETSVLVRWEWQQHPPMGLFAPLLPDPTGPAEQFVQVKWSAPCNMFLTVGAVQGTREYDRGMIVWDFHLLTPETESSTHYYFGSVRNFMVDDAVFNQVKLKNMIDTFKAEDEPLIAAVQAEMGGAEFWSLKPALLSSDPAPVKARRRLQKLIDEENAAMKAA